MDQSARVKKLNSVSGTSGKCVLYVMSRDQRVEDNHALLFAQKIALKQGLPLAVVFCLKPDVKNRSKEHYQWMIDGLIKVEKRLEKVSIPFLMLIGSPHDTLPGIIHHTNPSSVVFDMNPLRGPRRLQEKISQQKNVAVYVVDTHNVVPIWEVSQKQEYAARTIRTKIQRMITDYIVEPDSVVQHPHAWPGVVKKISALHPLITKLLGGILSNGQDIVYTTGSDEAHRVLQTFIDSRLRGYDTGRNDPSQDGQSNLSPYLHFGQISRLRVTLEIHHAMSKDESLKEDAGVFLEELNVRSSLSDNFCYFNKDYDSLKGAPEWAQKTLNDHRDDPREFIYTFAQFEAAKTHDSAWNAAQLQLVRTGKMHGYMRMYWAKKILEWSESPNDAVHIAIRLNDVYSLDGGDPNGYVGILWSITGLHDRPWFKRPIYGTIRYMNFNGLKRKFKIEKYIERFHE